MLVLVCVLPLQIICGPAEASVYRVGKSVYRVGKLLHGELQSVNVPVAVVV